MSKVIEVKPAYDVSIVVPIYNGEKYIAAKLESLIGIEGVNYEVIVALNKGSDRSEQVVNSYREKLPNLRVIQHSSLLTAGRNFQTGVEVANGNFIFVSAVDDICEKGFYREAITILSHINTACAVAPLSRFESNSNGNEVIGFELLGSVEERVVKLFQNIRVSHGIFYSLMRRSTATSLYRNFAKDSSIIGEDWLFCLRMALVGEVLRARGSECVFAVRGISRTENYLQTAVTSKLTQVFPYRDLAINILKLSKGQILRVKYSFFKISIQLLWGNLHRYIFRFYTSEIQRRR